MKKKVEKKKNHKQKSWLITQHKSKHTTPHCGVVWCLRLLLVGQRHLQQLLRSDQEVLDQTKLR